MTTCGCPEEGLRARKRTLANGVVHWGYQCGTCGKWQAKPKAAFDKEPSEDYDPDLSRKFWESHREEILRDRSEKNQEWWDRYNQYLQSEDWDKKRRAILARDNFTCQGCLGHRGKATQVHHMTYQHVGNELAFELISLCSHCHDKYHNEGAAW